MIKKTNILPEKEAIIELEKTIKELESKGAFIKRKQKKINYKSNNIYYEIEYNIKPLYKYDNQ